MTHEQDPFEKALAEFTEEDSTQRQLSEQFQENFRGLYDAALLRGGDPDDITHYVNLASRLAEIQTTTDATERRDKERELLVELDAYEVPQLVIDVTLSYFPMAPLTEEDAGLVAETIAKRDVELERVMAIMQKIDTLIDEQEEKTGEEIELNEHEDDFIVRFVRKYLDYLHETSDKDKPLKRANLLETLNLISDKANFHPVMRHVVTTLLNDDEQP